MCTGQRNENFLYEGRTAKQYERRTCIENLLFLYPFYANKLAPWPFFFPIYNLRHYSFALFLLLPSSEHRFLVIRQSGFDHCYNTFYM